MGKRPGDVIGNVRGEAQLTARPDGACEKSQRLFINEAALVVPFFRPGVGIENEGTGETGWRQTLEQETGVVIQYSNIGEVALVDLRHEFCDAVQKRFAAHDAHMGMGCGLMGEMFAAAEADLEPDLIDIAEQGLRVYPPVPKRNGDPRKEGLHQIRLTRLQGLALGAPINVAARAVGFAAQGVPSQRTAAAILSARSVFSQEKPPSESGVRPKWP